MAGLTAEQAANVRVIVAVGQERGVPVRGLLVALMTAAQESGLQNLDYGDRDSLGLFQQRPSMGWGTAAQVRDPAYASAAFYGGSASPTTNSTARVAPQAGLARGHAALRAAAPGGTPAARLHPLALVAHTHACLACRVLVRLSTRVRPRPSTRPPAD